MLSNKSFFPFTRFLSSYTKTSFFYSQTFEARKPNYYNILGIAQTATQAEIKNAYLKKGWSSSLFIFILIAKEYHPDVQYSDTKNSKNAEVL
jgi:hypothetical protein